MQVIILVLRVLLLLTQQAVSPKLIRFDDEHSEDFFVGWLHCTIFEDDDGIVTTVDNLGRPKWAFHLIGPDAASSQEEIGLRKLEDPVGRPYFLVHVGTQIHEFAWR